MNLRFACLLTVLGLLSACSQDDADEIATAVEKQDGHLSDSQTDEGLEPVRFFSSGISATVTTRTTGTTFENNDPIGIFVLNRTVSDTDELASSGNYADNVKYVYNGSEFVAAGDNPICQYTGKSRLTGEPLKWGPQDLSYYAVSPYTADLNPAGGTFSVKENQTTLSNYNASDLAFAKATSTDMSIGLGFTRLMSRVEITLTRGGTYSPSLFRSDIRVTFLKVRTKATINLNETNPLVAVQDDVADVVCYPMTGNDNYSRNKRVFQAILAPQLFDAEDGEYVLRVDIGTEAPRYCSLSRSVELQSGCQYRFVYTVEKVSTPGGNEQIDPVIE